VTAETRPRTTIAAGPRSFRGDERVRPHSSPARRQSTGRAHGRRSRRAAIDARWPVEDDDGVGRLVVARRRREVDDLEVRGDRLEQAQGPCRAGVVERDERVVEDERRPSVAGDEPDQPESRHQVDEVEGALAERADRDPVVLLRSVDLDVERLVVDPDPSVPAAGHRREVADHVRLEIPGRGLHGGLFGAIDRLEGRGVDALAAL